MKRNGYRTAEKFILSRELFGMKLGLENITSFLKEIGSPQDNFKSIHLAGTNGKGSTAAMLASIFTEQGYRTGLYTSPHLVDFRERIKVNDEKIPKTAVAAFIRKHHAVIRKRKLTFFEVVTALALDYFARLKVEIAVIETGLGGRLDATNVLRPILTMTTDIDFDHTEILGKTLRKISEEKAGIIKSGCPHLIGMLPKVSANLIAKVCQERNAPLHKLSQTEFSTNLQDMTIDFDDGVLRLNKISPSLYGFHQLKNTALVLKAISVLKQDHLKISDKAVKSGIENTDWPGRFQILENNIRPTVVLDVGHNLGGIKAFVDAFENRFPNRKARFLVGFVKKKNHSRIVNLLSGIASEFRLVPLKTRRSMSPDELIETLDFKRIPVSKSSTVAAGFARLTKDATSDDIICVVGSHYLVGEFLKEFGEKWLKIPDIRKIQSKPGLRRNIPQALRIRS